MKKTLIMLFCTALLLIMAACEGTKVGISTEQGGSESTTADADVLLAEGPAAGVSEPGGDELPEPDVADEQEDNAASAVSVEGTIFPDGDLVAVEPQRVPAYGVSFRLPSDWTYDVTQTDDDPTSTVTVSIRPAEPGMEGEMTFYCSDSPFGVCGTGLEQKDIIFNGHEARQGFYDGSPLWDFICLKDLEGCAVINSAKNWYEDYEEVIEQILSTVEFIYYGSEDRVVFRATVTEIGDGEMLVTPNEGYPEANYANSIRVIIQNMPGSPEPVVGDDVDITYNGIMTEEDPPSPCGVESITVIR